MFLRIGIGENKNSGIIFFDKILKKKIKGFRAIVNVIVF